MDWKGAIGFRDIIAHQYFDTETENEVVEAIDRLRGERTIITIAHRLSTLRGCDRLYRLVNGRIELEPSVWRHCWPIRTRLRW